jgi:transposase
MTQYQFVGVDVAKDKFDVALEVNNNCYQECFSNDIKGYRTFLKWLNKYTSQPWVCMEATGHYSELIADYLFEQKVRVSVVNPLQIKSFARAGLTRNKTDQLDARIIANYCKKMLPRVFVPRPESHKELKELINLLDALKGQLVRLTNQLHSTQCDSVKKTIRKLIKSLENEIAKVEKQLDEIIKNNQALNENMGLLTSIQGVGKQTAYKVLAHVPDMSCFANAKQFAAFIGISPRQHQSGKSQGKTRISRLGDARLRKVFYMAGLIAKRFNKRLQPFVTRLQANGKAPKAIICAVMRKLAHIVFSVLKNKRPFDVNYV